MGFSHDDILGAEHLVVYVIFTISAFLASAVLNRMTPSYAATAELLVLYELEPLLEIQCPKGSVHPEKMWLPIAAFHGTT